MRNTEKEIKEKAAMEAVLGEAVACRIALSDGGEPYIVPLNFVYSSGCLFIHTGKKGKKIDILLRNNRVCFEVDMRVEVVRAEEACGWNMRYASVIGFGRAFFLEETSEKRRVLDLLMAKYAGPGPFSYPERKVDATAVIRIDIDSMTGKRS